jgi:UDP-glucose 4-epimerase
MGRSFILGAGGFLGLRLASHMAAEGAEPVLAGMRAPLDLPGDAVQLPPGRLSDFEALEPYTGEGGTYYYMIASMTPSNSGVQPSSFISDNLELFVRFLEWVENKPGARVVYPSSGGTVYGNAEIVPTPETAPLQPLSFYGLLKATSENYLRMFIAQDRVQGTVLRIANPYGPGQKLNRGQGLIPALINRIRAEEPIYLIDGGKAIRDYVYIDDVVRALELAGTEQSLLNETLNVGSGVGYSVAEVLAMVEEVLGQKANARHAPYRSGDVHASVLDSSKLQSLTDWSPTHDLMEGLRRCL